MPAIMTPLLDVCIMHFLFTEAMSGKKPVPVFTATTGSSVTPPEGTPAIWANAIPGGGGSAPGVVYFGDIRPDRKPAHGGIYNGPKTGEKFGHIVYHG